LYSAYVLFFFSSRRRHTRFSRDWSSDVCSSDLEIMSDELRRAFNRAVWGAADDEGQPARLGRRDGTLRYIDALGNSYADRVWVTLDGNHGQSETVARCTTVPHVRNLPVRVAMRRGLLTVIGTD